MEKNLMPQKQELLHTSIPLDLCFSYSKGSTLVGRASSSSSSKRQERWGVSVRHQRSERSLGKGTEEEHFLCPKRIKHFREGTWHIPSPHIA